MLFSNGYSVNCWNGWVCLFRNPLSSSRRLCASLKPHGSAFIARQTFMCPPNISPIHTSRCLPEAGPNSPGPRRLHEPQVKWCRNKRAWQLLDRRKQKMLDRIPLT